MMKALATGSIARETPRGSCRQTRRHEIPPGAHISHAQNPGIQLKPGCACGGGCPRCQQQQSSRLKLRLNTPVDKLSGKQTDQRPRQEGADERRPLPLLLPTSRSGLPRSIFDGSTRTPSPPPRQRPTPGNTNVQPSADTYLVHTVDFVSLQGSDRNPGGDLLLANRVFADCGVRFNMGANHTIPSTQAALFIGFTDTMHVFEDDCPIGLVSRDTQQLFSYAQRAFALSAPLRVFYVPNYNGSSYGFSFFPECTAGPATRFNRHLVIRNGAPDRTLAHELGHILLNSGLHSGLVDSSDTDNLMIPSEYATNSLLDSAQCAVISGRTQA